MKESKTNDEILTHYILMAQGDPENDEMRKHWKETWGFAMYNLEVRAKELYQAIKKTLPTIK